MRCLKVYCSCWANIKAGCVFFPLGFFGSEFVFYLDKTTGSIFWEKYLHVRIREVERRMVQLLGCAISDGGATCGSPGTI